MKIVIGPVAALALAALVCACSPGAPSSAPGQAPSADASANGGELTPEIVKGVIEKPMGDARFTWRSVQIGQPRPATVAEASRLGFPPNAMIYPVKVDYTSAVGDGARDTIWNYYFYKDDSGGWSQQSNAINGNTESDLYHVDPPK